jgi:hypothetical protein
MEIVMNLVTNDKLEELLAASPAERVTREYMESRITMTSFHRIDDPNAPARPAPTARVWQISLAPAGVDW